MRRSIGFAALVSLWLTGSVWGQSPPGTGILVPNSISAIPGRLYSLSNSTAPINTPCNRGSLSTIFCNTTATGLSISQTLSGTSVGSNNNPSTGYVFNQNLAAFAAAGNNTSGNNQGTADNTGRTGALQFYSNTVNSGQGDYPSYFCDGFVNSTRSGATSFLAGPQVGCVGGQMLGGANGVLLQGIGDINFKDNVSSTAFDIGVFGLNFNFNRTSAVGALNTNWVAWSFQNQGTLPIDTVLRGTGATRVALDFSALSFPDNTLIGVTLGNGGSGYTAGDRLTAAGGTFDQQTILQALTVDGSGVILTFGLVQGGLYSVSPASSNSVTGGTGTGAVFTLQYTSSASPILATRANECWYGNATQDVGVFSTTYSSTLKLGTSWICYSSSLNAWNFVAGNSSVLQLGQSLAIMNQPFKMVSSIQSIGTVPTLTGSCTHSSVTGGAIAGTFTATCTAQTIIIALPSSTNGWHCKASDLSTPLDTLNQTASSTTSATLTGTTAASDVIEFNCFGF